MTQREETSQKSTYGHCIIPVALFIAIVGTGFCNIRVFTDSESNSKWYWLALVVSLGGLASLFLRRSERVYRPDGSALWLLPLFFYGLIRAAAGPFLPSFMASCTLFALLCLLCRTIVRRRPFAELAAPVAVATALLALHGIGQWTGWWPSGERFAVMGNFDNPAGYASMLALSLPFVLYFTDSPRHPLQCAAWGVWTLATTAIVLSASRAGIVTAVVITLAYLAKRYGIRWQNVAAWKKIASAVLAITLATGLYLAKRNSADGRLLIWKCTADMIGDKPLFGHGYKSFGAVYMPYQARFFERHPESRFAPLADNVKHPFNEFLRLTAEFGIAGLLLTTLSVGQIVWAYRRRPSGASFVLISTLAAVGIFACFSYPFSYPFTWFVTALATGGLPGRQDMQEVTTDDRRPNRIARLAITALNLSLAVYTACCMYYDARWHDITYRSATGNTGTVFDEYERLYPFLRSDPYFVYNYAARANYAGDLVRSTALAEVCESMLDDYDVQMLQADNFKRQGDFLRAEEHYRQASIMCPGRFMPLYELVNLYDATGRKDEADTLARAIVLKPAKIPSGTVSAIKTKMGKRFAND